MLRPYFGDSFDYDAVKISKEYSAFVLEGYGASFGNTFYVDSEDWSSDYSQETNLGVKTWFMHEMTHQWQSQQGYDVFLNGLVLLTQGGSQYDYRLDSLNLASFYNYNIESQADMIAHDYAFLNAISDKEFSDAIGIDDYNYLTQGNNIYALIQTVGEFMNLSHDSSWLPNSTFAFDYIRYDMDYNTVEKNLIIGSGKIVLSDGTTIIYSADVIDGLGNIISSTTYLANGLEDLQSNYFFSTIGDFLGNITGYDPENTLVSFDYISSDSDLLEFFQTQMTLNFIDTAGIYSSAFNRDPSEFYEYSVYSLDNKYYDTWNFSIDNIDELPQVQYDHNTMTITPEMYNPTLNYTANNDLFSSLYVSYNDGSVGTYATFQPYDNWASVNGISIGGSFSGDGYSFHIGFSWSFPVVLDLDGDGMLHQTGWVGADDGLLAA
ncbi:MAG: hypothetical protein JXQ77_05535 [Campylobacterales bacterium]|nr:hypothetical protein [Campylobacterales bacterium]